MIGSGAPTIGNNPTTIAIFTKIYKNKADAKPKQYSFAKNDLQEKPILIILKINKAYNKIRTIEPTKPSSSEKRVKIKSVCFSGKNSR